MRPNSDLWSVVGLTEGFSFTSRAPQSCPYTLQSHIAPHRGLGKSSPCAIAERTTSRPPTETPQKRRRSLFLARYLRQKPHKSVGGPPFLPGTSYINSIKVSEAPRCWVVTGSKYAGSCLFHCVCRICGRKLLDLYDFPVNVFWTAVGKISSVLPSGNEHITGIKYISRN